MTTINSDSEGNGNVKFIENKGHNMAFHEVEEVVFSYIHVMFRWG